MTLSDIKFNYQDKIDNLNSRIYRYKEIIEDYKVKIKRAEKEDNPNIDSVIHSMEQYQLKIQNMTHVKEYYQEFVDTSDYLMQNLNNDQTFQLIIQNETLTKEKQSLIKKINELNNNVQELEQSLENRRIINEVDKITIRSLKKKQRDLKKKESELKKQYREKESELKKQYREKESELKKQFKTKKIKDLETKNHDLEIRIEFLQEYCNDLLNRGTILNEPIR